MHPFCSATLVAAMSSALEKTLRGPAVWTDEDVNDANVRKAEAVADGIELSVKNHETATLACWSVIALKPIRCPAELVPSAGQWTRPLKADGGSRLISLRSRDKWDFGNWFHSAQLQWRRSLCHW